MNPNPRFDHPPATLPCACGQPSVITEPGFDRVGLPTAVRRCQDCATPKSSIPHFWPLNTPYRGLQ